MTAFAYEAVDHGGKARRGVIEAGSATAARQMLRDQRLLPVQVHPARAAPDRTTGFRLALPRRHRLGTRALSTLTRQLSTLIGSGIAIEEALRLTALQAESPAAKALILDVRGAIMDGQTFAFALGRHPSSFPAFYQASVAAGEQSGKLADVLAHLAAFVELRRRNQHKIQLALLYPALLAMLSTSMIALLLIYVVPDIVRVFVSRGTELPFLTRALIALSNGAQAFGPGIMLAALVFGFLARRWLAKPANRLRVDTLLIRYPPFARFSRQSNAARFAGSLATLVQSAVPLVDAIRAAAAVTPNRFVRAKALAIEQRVREGASLQVAMSEADVFPAMLVAIVASGENSGALGPALGRAAAELEDELAALTATLVGLVEPAVLLVMGGVVLLMVLAILLPIINLNNMVGLTR
jgi:general secretion pathway protein F